MEDHRTFFQKLCDRLALAYNGGARVRVYRHDAKLTIHAAGTVGRLKADAVSRMVLDLAPEYEGTINISRNDERWTISVAGSLADDGFEQRLRNLIVSSGH